MKNEVEGMIPVRLGSPLDLVKMSAILSAPHGAAHIIRFDLGNGKIVLGSLSVLKDYYKYYGLPVFYYVIVEGEEAEKLQDAKYIIYSTDTDSISYSRSPKPGRSIPIITLAEKPSFIPDLA